MHDKLYNISVYGILRVLTVAFGSDNAELILIRFVTGVIEATDISLKDCIIHQMGNTVDLQANIIQINTESMVTELVYNITVIQEADIIFSWQLCNNVLFFNMGKRNASTNPEPHL